MALAMRQPQNPRQRGNHAINVRQAKEDARREIVKQTEYYAATKQRSEFEEHTTAQIVRNAVRARFLELRRAHDQTIDDRRSQLVGLLSKDFATWREQLLANEETKEERLEHMRKRATELKARREAERKRIVEEKMYQRWRSGCDEIRAVESKALEREVAIGRLDQMREKQKSLVAAEEENRKWDEVWETERQKKVKREEFERAQQVAVNAATTAALDEQLRLLREQAENEERLKKEEAKLMREEMELRRIEEERARLRRLQEQRQTRQELDHFNKIRIQQRAKEVREALEMDMRIISEFAAMDETEKLDKARRREELRNEAQMYRRHLLEQREVEKRRAKEVDEMYAREQEKFWRARALRWKNEQEARDRLMADVIEGRREQIRRKIEINRTETRRAQEEKERLLRSIEEAQQREIELRSKIRAAQMHYKGELETQIRQVEEARAVGKEREMKQVELEQEAERRYQAFLEQELAKVEGRFRNVDLSVASAGPILSPDRLHLLYNHPVDPGPAGSDNSELYRRGQSPAGRTTMDRA